MMFQAASATAVLAAFFVLAEWKWTYVKADNMPKKHYTLLILSLHLSIHFQSNGVLLLLECLVALLPSLQDILGHALELGLREFG